MNYFTNLTFILRNYPISSYFSTKSKPWLSLFFLLLSLSFINESLEARNFGEKSEGFTFALDSFPKPGAFYFKWPSNLRNYSCTDFGVPEIFNSDCTDFHISADDQAQIAPDACYRLNRTWTITNTCAYNPGDTCIWISNDNTNTNLLFSPFPPDSGHPNAASSTKAYNDYLSFLNPDSSMAYHCFKYRQVVWVTDTLNPQASVLPFTMLQTVNNPHFYNDSTLYDPVMRSHDICESEMILKAKGTDECSREKVSFHFLIFFDLDDNGSFDTKYDSRNPGTPGVLFKGNLMYPAGSPLIKPVKFDSRPVPANQRYVFGVQTTTMGDEAEAQLVWKEIGRINDPNHGVLPRFPTGKARIYWTIEDECHRTWGADQTLTVADTTPPTLVCKSNLMVAAFAQNPILLGASDLIEQIEDNCTPRDSLEVGICMSNYPSFNDNCYGFFPYDLNGPDTMVQISCYMWYYNPIIEIWVKDKAGNLSRCDATINVFDPAGNCDPNLQLTFIGNVASTRPNGLIGLRDASIQTEGFSTFTNFPTQNTLSDSLGNFSLPNLPLLGHFKITPTKNDDLKNGLEVTDMLLIQRHILGTSRITNPYLLIAADVNRSGDITALDIVELRKILLGLYDTDGFPLNTSWRFVDRSIVFTDTSNPFQDSIRGIVFMDPLNYTTTSPNFEAIKVGDIDQSSVLQLQNKADDREVKTDFFELHETKFPDSDLIQVDFRIPKHVSAWQLYLAFDDLEVVEILPGEVLSMENFAIFPKEGRLSMVSEVNGASFSIIFKTTTATSSIREKLFLDKGILKKQLAVAQNGDKSQIDLFFAEENRDLEASKHLKVFQNRPNPVRQQTTIQFYLPESGKVHLAITDQNGGLVFQKAQHFQKGIQAFTLNNTELPSTSGVYFYKISTDKESSVKKLIIIE